MRGIFCATTARNNEEYKKVVKTKMGIFAMVMVMGIIMAIVASGAAAKEIAALPEHMLNVYCGTGTGLAAAGLVLLIKNLLLLKQEEKLTQERLKNADERLHQVGNKALRMGVMAMLTTFYAIALIGGIFYPVLVKVLLIVMPVFLAVYMLSYWYYEKKM